MPVQLVQLGGASSQGEGSSVSGDGRRTQRLLLSISLKLARPPTVQGVGSREAHSSTRKKYTSVCRPLALLCRFQNM